MGKNNCPTLPLYLVLILVLSGPGLSGCRLRSTLPPIAPGTDAIIDICIEDPTHPDYVPWQTFSDPLGRFTFGYPTDWYTMTVTPDPADGVYLMNAPSLEEATEWISLLVCQNPKRLSPAVWVAERGVSWPGEIIDSQENQIGGVPVLYQRLKNDDPATGGPFIYTLVYYPLGENMLEWTACPGDRTETLDLLERILYSFQISK